MLTWVRSCCRRHLSEHWRRDVFTGDVWICDIAGWNRTIFFGHAFCSRGGGSFVEVQLGSEDELFFCFVSFFCQRPNTANHLNDAPTKKRNVKKKQIERNTAFTETVNMYFYVAFELCVFKFWVLKHFCVVAFCTGPWLPLYITPTPKQKQLTKQQQNNNLKKNCLILLPLPHMHVSTDVTKSHWLFKNRISRLYNIQERMVNTHTWRKHKDEVDEENTVIVAPRRAWQWRRVPKAKNAA